METVKNSLKSTIEDFIIRWNRDFPFDYIWRKKYGIAFGSQIHRETSFFSMLIDLKEEKMIKEAIEQYQEEEEENEMKQLLGGGERKKFVKMTEKEIDQEFEALDLAEINKLNESIKESGKQGN